MRNSATSVPRAEAGFAEGCGRQPTAKKLLITSLIFFFNFLLSTWDCPKGVPSGSTRTVSNSPLCPCIVAMTTLTMSGAKMPHPSPAHIQMTSTPASGTYSIISSISFIPSVTRTAPIAVANLIRPHLFIANPVRAKAKGNVSTTDSNFAPTCTVDLSRTLHRKNTSW